MNSCCYSSLALADITKTCNKDTNTETVKKKLHLRIEDIGGEFHFEKPLLNMKYL